MSTSKYPTWKKSTEQELSDEEVIEALVQLAGWEVQGWKKAERITKGFGVPNLNTALEFVKTIASLATGRQDRIEIYLNHKHVRLALGTLDTITQEDIALARRIDAEASRFPKVVPRVPPQH